MIHARSETERELDRMMLDEPERADVLLRGYFALLGGGAADVADALERAERGEEPHGGDLADPRVQAEFPRALVDIRAERSRRESERDVALRRAAGILAVGRARGQVGEMDA
jgi:hypothetical protein